MSKADPVPTVDDLIDRIDGRDEEGTLALLRSHPQLATGTSLRDGVLAGATPLHWAAHRDQLRLCAALLDAGADVDSSAARWWRTPLAWAADAGCLAAVELLLSRGADADRDAFGNTSALHAAAQGGSTGGKRDPAAYAAIVDRLVDAGADVNRLAEGDGGQSPLGDAVRAGNDAVAEALRRHGAREVPRRS